MSNFSFLFQPYCTCPHNTELISDSDSKVSDEGIFEDVSTSEDEDNDVNNNDGEDSI